MNDLISRKAAMAECQTIADDAKTYNMPRMAMGANGCRDAIAAIPAALAANLTDPDGEAEALRRENARLKVKLDRREKLLDSVILERTHYRKRAEAAEAALAASRAPDPVVNAGSCQPGDLISRAAAIEALGFAAWMHQGTDAYSQGMDAGARHQAKQDYEAIRALPAAPVAEAATCLHLTADMAARCPTCNPGLSTSLPDTETEAQPVVHTGAFPDRIVLYAKTDDFGVVGCAEGIWLDPVQDAVEISTRVRNQRAEIREYVPADAAPVAEAQPVAWLQRHRLGPYILSGPDNTETDEWSAPFRVYAHPPEQPAIDRAQCCMCGKTGLSTAEDGGPECELSDGRWVCTAECYDRAVPQPTIGGAELDALVAECAQSAREVFADTCNHTKQGIDYLEQVMLTALRAQPDWKAMAEPDYCYNPEDWEYTQPWDARHELAESVLDYGRDNEPARVSTLISGPDKWVTRLPLDTDGDGEADDWEYRWFDSEEAARAALSDLAKMKGDNK